MTNSDDIEQQYIAESKQGGGKKWPYFIVAIVIYKLLVDLTYYQVAELYDYQRFFYIENTTLTAVSSWLLLLCALPAIKYVFDSPTASGKVLSILTLFSVIPFLTCVLYRSDYGFRYVVLTSVFWSLFFFAWLKMKPIRFRKLEAIRSSRVAIIVAIILSTSVVIYSYINTGLRFHFGLIDVYDIRAEARGFEAPFPVNYLVSHADNILPVLAVYFFMANKRILSLATILIIFINFSISGAKLLLFVTFIGFLGYYALDEYKKYYRLIIGSVILAALCYLQYAITGDNSLHGIFTYRVLFIPTELNFSYYDYFQTHQILYYSQSLLKSYYSASQENIQFILGEYAVSDYSARANNGLFSDAYMNLGMVGVLVYPVILAGFLRMIDGAVTGLPQRFIFVVVLCVAFVLISMTLTAALLTSGLLVMVFLLYSLPRDSSDMAMATVGRPYEAALTAQVG